MNIKSPNHKGCFLGGAGKGYTVESVHVFRVADSA